MLCNGSKTILQQHFANELEKQAAVSFRQHIAGRLDSLLKAGIGYISTNRIVGTLSGGEFQRLQLARLVRDPFTGVAYILDEPSFGLHPKDAKRISDLILNLNQHGNSVVMVEHSPALLEKSDYIIEMGPAAGNEGGQIIYSGNKKEIPVNDVNISGQFHHNGKPGKGLNNIKAHANNLQNIDIEIPSGIMTVITGVSGSGKTSLLDKVIYESYTCQKSVIL